MNKMDSTSTIINPSTARRRGWKQKARGSKLKFFKGGRKFKNNKFFKSKEKLGNRRDVAGGWSPRRGKNTHATKVKNWSKNPQHHRAVGYKFRRFKKWNNKFFKQRRPQPFKEMFLRRFTKGTYYFFKKDDASLHEKLGMDNYWNAFNEVIDPTFSFTYSQLDGVFYLGVVRSYMSAIKFFIKSFLKNTVAEYSQNSNSEVVLNAFYQAYRVQTLVDHLAVLYEKPLGKPDYYFPGYRLFLRLSFFRHLAIFCTKIFILVNQAFSQKTLRIDTHLVFFQLWKKTYKNWLNIYYQKKTVKYKVPRVDWNLLKAARAVMVANGRRNSLFWRKLFRFRIDRAGYKRTLLNYFFKYAWANFNTVWPFSYRKKKARFKYNIFGHRIYLQRKPLFRRKSRKYIRWFRTLVTGGYYFSPSYAEKTFYRLGYGRRAWMSRRRARHVFKMKFVFIRYFSKRFGLKNRTAFLRKAQEIARKRGNKWIRYYKQFESRLQRVLVLFGLSSNDEMAKNLISSNSVLVNRRLLNDHHHKFIPRVKMGDLVSLTTSATPYFLRKKFKFFKKRLSFFDRGEEAKLVYSLFKKYFLEWTLPSAYTINGPIVRHGLSALMSGPVVTNSRAYFKINRFIPFFNRTLFKIFIQRFSKKLN